MSEMFDKAGYDWGCGFGSQLAQLRRATEADPGGVSQVAPIGVRRDVEPERQALLLRHRLTSLLVRVLSRAC